MKKVLKNKKKKDINNNRNSESKTRRKLSYQKIFCVISFCFILSCFIFYGSRFIKYYLESHKEEEKISNTIVAKIKDDNFGKDYFKNISNEYYFYGKDINNNYINYSNMLWRIIKIDDNNNITLVLDEVITSLAYGEDIESYDDSMINSWLNNKDSNYTGILENNLNKVSNYLNKVTICTDKTDNIDNSCNTKNSDYYLGLLSISDYVNTGNTNSFLISNKNIYLSNTNNDNNIWYLNSEGKLSTNNGTTSMGIRPVISLKGSNDYLTGTGSKENPYCFEKENSYFASYVKLDDDIWRVYDTKDTELRLVLTDYIKEDNEKIKYNFSNYSAYFDDSKPQTGPYYMNNTYLNNLSYKDIIKSTTWSNGSYGESNNYDYTKTLDITIDSKVAFLSIGNVIFEGLDNYFIMNGININSNSVYTILENYKLFGKSTTSSSYLVPTICIDKSNLVKGKGTIDSPYEME